MEREIVLELFDRYADMVYRIALSYLRSPQEAEDAVQTVFLKLLEGGVSIHPGKERAFLGKVAVNHCKNLLSAAKRHEAVPLDEAVLLTHPEDREVFRAVMELPEKYRIVVSLSSDPALRSRRVGRVDGAEKMEYTAENPANLLDTLTGRVMIDLTWMHDNYKYIPDANLSYVVTDKKGNYVSEAFEALYAKPDDSGYVRVTLENMAEADYFAQAYIVDGSYETAYYYTTPDGYEFLITMNTGNVWVECNTSHANISMYGAYLTSDEIEDILDNLSLSVAEQP